MKSSMKKLIITGPVKTQGDVEIAGAKNSSLPILAASILCKKELVLNNVPKLLDIVSMLETLCMLGSRICLNDDDSINIHNELCTQKTLPEPLTSRTRASILFLGPMLARFGKASIALPGGCNFGERPIDLHIEGLKKLGAEIVIKDNMIHAEAPNGLNGTRIYLQKASVGATENLVMAATLAKGKTTIENCALEPEIFDLINFLNKMGAKITHSDTCTLTVEGVKTLSGCHHSIIGDRVEAGTYLIAAAATKGQVTTRKVNPEHLGSVIEKLRACGAQISTGEDYISLSMPNHPKAVEVKTAPYPGFPTDLQAQWLALNIIAEGQSCITDTIYETRTSHVSELVKLSASIQCENNSIHASGSSRLQGAQVCATDIRASAGLIIAGMCAQGETHILNTDYVDRGYVALEEKLRKIGAKIQRTEVNSTFIES